jgi:hypothetical protein
VATPAQLERAGVTPEKLKAIFTAETLTSNPKQLLEQISSRVKDGVQRTMREARLWWAIDRAYDVPFRQTAHTMVEGLLAKNIDDREVQRIAKDWGLTHMLVPMTDPKGNICCWPGTRDPKMRLNLPTFTQIFVPLVQAYSKIRWAKLFSDIDQSPLYKYEPLKLTNKNRLKCEIITDRVDTMTTQMGYRMAERDSIFQMLQYGICLNFPMEKWYTEEQLDDKGDPEIVKEGIRWAIPHPSKMFFDLAHRTSTINSDTGCEYAGYWDIMRWRDVRLNKAYFNTDKVSYGPSDFVTGYWNPYNDLYPCQMAFPTVASPVSGDLDRQKQLGVYTEAEDDKATVVVPYFAKLVPSEWGLGDYDYPVWFRFVMGHTDTVIFAEPLCYRPTTYYGYDADTNRHLNAGLGLELLPWQDMLGNYLSQLLYSIKKNLASVSFYNQEIVSEEDIRRINAPGEELYRGLMFIGKSKRELGWQQTATDEAFHNVSFPKHNIQEITTGITVLLSTLERMLGFSSQEVGQAAVHEQSATEITTIHGNSTVRLDHTRGFVEDGMNARKRSIYDGMMAYSDDEIFAQIGELNDTSRKELKTLGFEVEEEAEPGRTKSGVRGNKKSLDMDGFAANREGGKRINNIQIAAAMIKMFETILAQPLLVQAMGIPQIADMLNLVFTYAGLPQDYKISVKEGAATMVPGQDGQPGPEQEAQKQELLKQLAAISQKVATEVVNASMEQLTGVLKEKVIDPIQEAIQATQKVVAQEGQKNLEQDAALEKLFQILQAAMQPPPGLGQGPGGPPMPPPMAMPPQPMPQNPNVNPQINPVI